jgi:hypothetical protein
VEKQRSGVSGATYPFAIHEVEINDKGDTSICLEWKDEQKEPGQIKVLNAIKQLLSDNPEGVPKALLREYLWNLDPRKTEGKAYVNSFRSTINRDIRKLITKDYINKTETPNGALFTLNDSKAEQGDNNVS